MDNKMDNKMENSSNLSAILANTGIELDTSKVKAARRNLYRSGAASANLDDEVVIAADRINAALTASENSVKTACYIAGALRLSECWKEQKDDAGKPYKSENAFLKSILPGYATSTVTLYADVGATIYIPAANGEFKDLPELDKITPSNAKFLLSAIKDAEKRKALPAALEEAKKANGGKLTQKAIASAVKSLNQPSLSTGGSASRGSIADDLSGGAFSVTVAKLISFARNGDKGDGDLTAIVLERDVKDFMSLLLKARDNADTATAFCDILYTLAKKAK